MSGLYTGKLHKVQGPGKFFPIVTFDHRTGCVSGTHLLQKQRSEISFFVRMRGVVVSQVSKPISGSILLGEAHQTKVILRVDYFREPNKDGLISCTGAMRDSEDEKHTFEVLGEIAPSSGRRRGAGFGRVCIAVHPDFSCCHRNHAGYRVRGEQSIHQRQKYAFASVDQYRMAR